MTYYIALIHKEPKSDFGVSFPDFPGCITAGSTVQEAMAVAREALAGHIAAMIDEGLPIPAPSAVDAVMRKRANRDGVAAMVPAPDTDDRAVRLNVTLPANLIRAIDERTPNRSRFLAQAAALQLQSADPLRKSRRRAAGPARRSASRGKQARAKGAPAKAGT
jgi:predicted RNase H-like HicB family nuclease